MIASPAVSKNVSTSNSEGDKRAPFILYFLSVKTTSFGFMRGSHAVLILGRVFMLG